MSLLRWTSTMDSYLVSRLFDWWNKGYSMSSTDEKPLPPGGMGWPIVGETLQFLMKGTEFYTEKLKEYGNIFKCNILGSSTIRITGAENIRPLIDKEPKQLTMKWPKAVNILMGRKSLPTVIGPEHTKLKTHLQKAFTPTRLSDYFPCVQEHLDAHVQKWLDKGKEKKYVLGFPACEDMIADVMLELVMGCNKEDDKDGRMRQAFKDLNHSLLVVPIKLPYSGFSKACNARETILKFVESRMSGEGSEKNHVSMMDILLTLHGPGEDMDEEKVKDNALGLMLAAAASLSGGLTIIILLLGTYPEVLEKVREELKEFGLFGQDASAEWSYDLLGKLEYVHCVVKESLRFMPPVGACFRKTENEMEVDKYRMPSDWTVIYSIRDTHSLTAKLLQDGDSFLPSRWMKHEQEGGSKDTTSGAASVDISKIADSSSCHFIPFGVGPRMCIGRQLAKMMSAMLVIKLATTARWELKNPKCPLVYLPVTKPRDDMPVLFEKLQ